METVSCRPGAPLKIMRSVKAGMLLTRALIVSTLVTGRKGPSQSHAGPTVNLGNACV